MVAFLLASIAFTPLLLWFLLYRAVCDQVDTNGKVYRSAHDAKAIVRRETIHYPLFWIWLAYFTVFSMLCLHGLGWVDATPIAEVVGRVLGCILGTIVGILNA